MEVLTRLLPKLAELLVTEYNLQKEVKGGIIFLQAELESMKAVLEKVSKTPAEQLDEQDKIWARAVRELSYHIEDRVDTFMVHCQGRKPAKQHGFKKVVDRSLDLFMQPQIRRKIAIDIRDIKCRVEEVGKRRDRYKMGSVAANTATVTIDPRLLGQRKLATELVGIHEARDELIKILIGGDEAPMKQGKIVSIVGFGGIGKTTLANAVYEKISSQFKCWAFVLVSQTPDMKKLFKRILHNLGKRINDETLDEEGLINELTEFLRDKRYFIVVDDIWDIQVLEVLRRALPHNNSGYRIVVTTRIVDVGERADVVYKMKPLSIHNSKILLYRRIFGNEGPEECHDEMLTKVSDKILKKCAGVPLAIITIASLLASKGRNEMNWYEVHKSIGIGLENSFDLNNMRKILSLSYYDLPSHLMTCLLYLSLFPEDYKIEKDRLIWLWIAEGFIHCGKEHGKSLFEVGESYFNDLINRSLIQHTCSYDGITDYCVLHDMVLDLIHPLSREELFVTILNDSNHRSPLTAIRRLSIQSGKIAQVTNRDIKQQVRSVVAFPPVVDQMPSLRSFKVLRVLDLQDCDLSQGCSLKHIGKLFHLRYLGLKNTNIAELPQEIGNLRILETLDVRNNNQLSSLPSTVVHLKHLMCLCVDEDTKVPNRISSLTSLEKFSWLHIEEDSTDVIEDLGLLKELRVLDIVLSTKWNQEASCACFVGACQRDHYACQASQPQWKISHHSVTNGVLKVVELLGKLQKIQSLEIRVKTSKLCSIGGFNVRIAPRNLRTLRIKGACWFLKLPAWINSLHVLDLSILTIAVKELKQEDLKTLGRLPSLRYLDLMVDHSCLEISGRFIIGAGLFTRMVHCELCGICKACGVSERSYADAHRTCL